MDSFVANFVTTNMSLAARSRLRGVALKFMWIEQLGSSVWNEL